MFMTDVHRNWLDTVLRGNDGRIRATYRVLLAYLLFFAVGILIQVLAFVVIELSVTLLTFALIITLQALMLITLFYVLWAQRLDQRPLEGYGIDVSMDDAVWFVTAFVVTLIGVGLWFGLWISTGRLSAEIALSYPDGSLFVGTIVTSVAIIMGAVAQGVVFIGLMFVNTVAGLRSRVADETVAVVNGVVITGGFFIAYHFLLNTGAASFLPTAQAIVVLSGGFLYIVGVYLYSRSLLAGIGGHSAANYSAFFYGLEGGADNAPFAWPEIINIAGSTPLTEVFGPVPVPGMALSFVLLLIIAQSPIVNSSSEIFTSQS